MINRDISREASQNQKGSQKISIEEIINFGPLTLNQLPVFVLSHSYFDITFKIIKQLFHLKDFLFILKFLHYSLIIKFFSFSPFVVQSVEPDTPESYKSLWPETSKNKKNLISDSLGDRTNF